ncbi:MAG TPA: tyrosine-type recombinase/integrase, partial [Polyangiaceae bacterium]|nr:tyrosine-type recombinase/integrase [Polyangiaceae bacterium]
DKVMSKLPPELSAASRRQIAQLMHRVLGLGVFPLRLREANPLPRGWLPKPTNGKAKSWLYPEEEAQLLRCTRVPLGHRVAYGVLAREGMRKSELLALTWDDVDLKRGAVSLDENKTDDPRTWALGDDVVAALHAWRDLCGKPEHGPVFTELDGTQLILRADGDDDDRERTKGEPYRPPRRGLRAHLKLAGVDRAQLFERSAARQPVRLHDLRATFVTLALATGRSETWVADRTGHRSSQMINKYRRAARTAAELDLGWFKPMHQFIPELAAASKKKGGTVVHMNARRRKRAR